jgi:hypothetical protein
VEKGPRVFISYAREDVEAARRLYEDLKEAGLNPWMDEVNLRAGQQWKVGIRYAIRDCRYFIALLSSTSASRKGYVHKEMKEALELLDMFPDTEVFLIPVRLNDCPISHEKLRDLNWVDLFPSWEKGIDRITRTIAPEATMASSSHHDLSKVSLIVEKFTPFSSLALNAEFLFSIKNTSSEQIVVYDVGLQGIDASGLSFPAPHAMSCRVTLRASLSKIGQQPQTEELLQCACHQLYEDDVPSPGWSDIFSKDKPESALSFKQRYRLEEEQIISEHLWAHHDGSRRPYVKQDGIMFHSIISPDSVLNLAPAENEAFRFLISTAPGCGHVGVRFRFKAAYHDQRGAKADALSERAYEVLAGREGIRTRPLDFQR